MADIAEQIIALPNNISAEQWANASLSQKQHWVNNAELGHFALEPTGVHPILEAFALAQQLDNYLNFKSAVLLHRELGVGDVVGQIVNNLDKAILSKELKTE